ncbi:hypothetical protein PTTG_03074 [Puccinia triticina 1-1 BBBD Race 1]|uniref:Pectinesterase n=2 Tax=Puccinia triticina TaxID=208348 RepID=A0A180GNR1_PUCT1|nr:uncharacterized protein PtA15_12A347 [Puccinia triticina]OAV94446.1 hypothetical protein PTTG_03074 [Puccinia triticina 1-1 BBBD Race 1]WAQ90358.1 hypothetical protein PtA15_12A347 [Puccinia triticina]WAR61676.1 hypothetical protein PtB15_12B366 [Puccinia triticina]
MASAIVIYILFSLLYTSQICVSSYIPSAALHQKRGQENSFSSTDPPPGSLVVRQNNAHHGEFNTITAAVNALKTLKGPQIIFITAGTYHEQVHIKYKYPLRIQGYSSDPTSLASNQVTVQVAVSAASRGGENAPSSAIWVQSPRFEMRNVNAINSFGTGTDTQAVALTAEGQKHVYKYCTFSSYQDTLLVKTLSSYFYGCRVEGAVDFIFGPGTAWFEMSEIVVKPPKHYATITAQRRSQGGNTMFVINKSKVLPSSQTTQPGSVYFGRPWSPYAAVVFQNSFLSNIVNPLGWIPWNEGSEPRNEHVTYQEYGNYGPGSSTQKRQMGTVRSEAVKISAVLGSDYAEWAN